VNVGDRVHVARLGTGVVRESRNGGRFLVEVKGRAMVVAAGELEAAEPARARKTKPPEHAPSTLTSEVGARSTVEESKCDRSVTIDLHGKTVEEALTALDAFLNDALLAGAAAAQVIHGRSGGRVKSAVHRRLKDVASVRGFRIDPRNPGVTIVTF
jgi:DNA mismatch repair protein MutS2